MNRKYKQKLFFHSGGNYRMKYGFFRHNSYSHFSNEQWIKNEIEFLKNRLTFLEEQLADNTKNQNKFNQNNITMNFRRKFEHRHGYGDGQGGGKGGRNNGGGFGPGGFCVCAKCGEKVPHQAGVKCTEVKCPKCNHTMVREELLLRNQKK